MKNLFLIGFLSLTSLSAFAYTYCESVGRIYTVKNLNSSEGNTTPYAVVGSETIQNLALSELSLLVAAKSNNLKICIDAKNDAVLGASRVIYLK